MDLRKERTLKLLDDAFTELIEEKPYEEISVAELCEHAMIRRATFYRHFPNKEEYLAFYVQNRRSKIDNKVASSFDGLSMNGYCKAMTTELVKLAYRNKKILRGLKLSSSRDAFIAALARTLAKDFESLLHSHDSFNQEVGDTTQAAAMAQFYISGILAALLTLFENKASEEEAQASLAAIIDCLHFPTLQDEPDTLAV